jgi:hypothetical protein
MIFGNLAVRVAVGSQNMPHPSFCTAGAAHSGKPACLISARHGVVPLQVNKRSVVVEAQVAENFDRFKEEIHKEKIMSDFRIKLLGLAALATVFTGLSYGQVSCLTAPGGTLEPTSLNTVSPILDRAESEADLVSDVILLCPSSTATANGQLTVFASLPVSSKAVTGATGGGTGLPAGYALPAAGTFSGTAGNSEAVLTICPAQAIGTGCSAVASAYYQGTVSGSIVSFSGVVFPASFTAQISNIRLNLSGAAKYAFADN